MEKNVIEKILEIDKKKNIENIKRYMEKNKIKLVKYSEKDYPNSLKNIEDFPIYIYVRGNLNNIYLDAIAIVGSRIASEYGKNVARSLAYNLVKRNINIISGLAIGIDKAAHLGALDFKEGKTIGVLATSVLEEEMYPFQNKKVFERILENNGTLVSEYFFGSKLQKYKFIERNRIISGLAKKIIVVEAGEKSGSIITADFALEQGKDVFVVPGNINLENFRGSNNLIKEGAYLLNEIEDLF